MKFFSLLVLTLCISVINAQDKKTNDEILGVWMTGSGNAKVEIFKKGKNNENVINKSKTTGEPPLMNAMSVFFAIKNAIASVGNYNIIPNLNAPATPEKILMSIKQLKRKI
mgnify:CR=1 FL=1